MRNPIEDLTSIQVLHVSCRYSRVSQIARFLPVNKTPMPAVARSHRRSLYRPASPMLVSKDCDACNRIIAGLVDSHIERNIRRFEVTYKSVDGCGRIKRQLDSQI